jgi:3',5'-cyclic AMP phosphodiesterase CpdA
MKYIINYNQVRLKILSINFIAAVTIKFFTLAVLNAQPSLIHLSLGAKLSEKEAAPVSITWYSEKPGEKQFVMYRTDPGREKLRESVTANLCGDSILVAELKHLRKGTKYYYICGSEKAGWSPVYSFSSEPDSDALTIAVIGDTQNSSDNSGFQKTKLIADLAKSYDPELTLHMGDIVENGSIPANWKGFLTATEGLNTISPLMPVLGNHDIQNDTGEEFQQPFREFLELFNLPGDEVNYSFTYMNVRFIGIFSGYAQAAAKTGQVKYRPDSPEYKWLDSELLKAGADDSISWIILWMHYPVNSFGWSNVKEWKDNILPLIQKHKVNLCLAGHRHVYERHHQVKDGKPVRPVPGQPLKSVDGTVFITNGTAGGNPTGQGGINIPTMAFTPDKAFYSFAIIEINKNSFTYSVYDQENLLVDRFIMKK